MFELALLSWHWFLAAILLMIIEVAVPGAFLLWLGIAAACVSIIVFVIPLSFASQVFVFAFFSIISIIIGKKYFTKSLRITDHPHLNRRSESYIGRVFVLEEPIVDGHGKITIDDSSWKIVGENCDAGTYIRIIGIEGASLLQVNVVDTNL
jgi:membrane protein implicated in regulation of membrane protease activity